MKKELYSAPELEVILFSISGIVATSNGKDEDPNQGEWDPFGEN